MSFKQKKLIMYSQKLLGTRGVLWILIVVMAAAGIAAVELCISIVLQLLLISLGFISTPVKILGHSAPIWSVQSVTILLSVVAVARFVVQLTTTQTASFMRDYVSHRLRKNVIHQMIFDESEEARAISLINYKISEIFVKASEFAYYFTAFLSMFVQIIFLFIVMFLISWKESFTACVGVALIGAVVLTINKKVSTLAKQVPKEQIKLNEGITKIARNFLFIKLMKKQRDEYHNLTDAVDEYSSKSVSANFFSNLSAQTGPFLGILLLICIILIGQNFWHTPPLILISFIYLLARFVQSLSILSGYFGYTTLYLPQYELALKTIENHSFNGVCETSGDQISFFGKRQKYQGHKKNQSTSLPLNMPSQAPDVVFKNTSFSYDDLHPLFDHLNLQIQAGSQVGLVGPSGSGKSTLLFLITGVLQPSQGQILIDDLSAKEYSSSPHTRIGYVGIEPFLIKGTLRENLCYGLATSVDHNEICEVLKLVSLDSLLHEKGLEFKITEEHTGLSAGQKQRLCLARAILNKPNLLILDEATANLDEQNELLVAEALNELKGTCTTIIVSHRPGILVHADQVIELKKLLSRN